MACSSCPDTVYGVRNEDTIQTTIIGPYPGDAAPETGPSCDGLDDIVPGTTFTLYASLNSPAEMCSPELALTIKSTDDPALTGGFLVDASSGCTGRVSLQFVSLASNVSVFHDNPDGGPYAWVVEREFDPTGDGGPCPVQVTCTDAFVAQNRLVQP
jgi:hypothetical protein